MAAAAISVEGLWKRFRVYHRRNTTLKETVLQRSRGSSEEFWAVKDVSFEVPQGASLGIIGENGSGKSTLLKCVAGILTPDRGRVHFEGRLSALLELGAGFHPDYSGRENIYLNAALLGLPRRYIDTVIDDIIEFAGGQVARAIDNPVKNYSSGMYARLGFSIAVHVNPDILVIDEILAVGDEAFQRKCYDRIADMKAQGRTLVVVSHALESIQQLCDSVLWMDQGVMRAYEQNTGVVSDYLREVNARESQQMRAEVDRVRELVPTGRDGVGVTTVRFWSDGQERQVVETGSDFEVAVEYHAPGPLTGVRFRVAFVREDGVLAFAVTTDDRDMLALALPATGEVRLRIPELPLLEGRFRTSVSIVEVATQEPYTILESAFPFRVRGGGEGEAGVARLRHHWQLPRDGARRAELQAEAGASTRAPG
jgi:ABC-2 type transport system ATP-binding protein